MSVVPVSMAASGLLPMLAEFLRIFFGTKAVGYDNLVYGVLLVLFIIFLPKGILGSLLDRLKNGRAKAVRFSTLEAMCRVLDCQPGDLLEWVDD